MRSKEYILSKSNIGISVQNLNWKPIFGFQFRIWTENHTFSFEFRIWTETRVFSSDSELKTRVSVQILNWNPKMGFQFRFWTEKLNMTFSKIWYKLKLSGPTCSRGDVVLVASATGFDAGEVACFLSKGNQDMCILYIFSFREKLPKHCVWEEMQNQEGVPLSATFAPVFICKSKKGVTTLTPWQWQWQDQFHQKKSGQKSAIALYVHLQHAITWSCLDVLVTPGALLEAHSAHCLKHTVLVAWSTQC